VSNKALRVFNEATAIITGGASGIGRALGKELAQRGSEVVLADLQLELAASAASEIRATGGKAVARRLDVTDFSVVESLLQETVERTGRLDYMFNNAGISITGPMSLHSIEDWNRIIDVNLRGVVNGVQAGYQVMLRQGFGHIVNTASLVGLVPGVGNPSYVTTKHAVVGLSKIFRAEAATKGIQVSVLCPGIVRTPCWIEGENTAKTYRSCLPKKNKVNVIFWRNPSRWHPTYSQSKHWTRLRKTKPLSSYRLRPGFSGGSTAYLRH